MVRILIADDDPANRRLAERLLEKLGVDYASVVDGQEAVDAAVAGDFDLVLMDFHMPRMDGPEATEAIRAALGDRAPRIVGLTATAREADMQRCLDAGMIAVHPKPPRLALLQALIDDLP